MASSSTNRVWIYDVFISFRGEDTRKTFVSHLDKALFSRGIATFKDNRKLEVGDSIPDELRAAIRASRFAVVVVSENYATSSWCLDELQQIMEEDEVEVVPIFYGVKPSQVRCQLGSFSLERYQDSDKVPGWRKALTDIGNIKGKESTQCVDDATMIEEIVQRISSRLYSMLPMDFSDIVGMKSHMEALSPLLDMEAGDARIIGISGAGGIGKTTIAKYLYEQLKPRFPSHHYFMENVSKLSGEHGLLYLQHKLLSNIFREENMKLESVEHGRQQLEFRLRHVRVLLVLDDVDDAKQVSALAKDIRWFGPGSRIIVTTRDKRLLNSCGVYDVNYLDDDVALQLFERIAFQGDQPPSSSDYYKDLLCRVSRLARGLPLALQAFGFYLQKSPLKEWNAALASFEFEYAHNHNIRRIMNISYEGLDESSKSAFLHVACIFNRDPIWCVKTLLDRGEVGTKVLAEKSLIDISAEGLIDMHFLLKEVGRNNVQNRPSQKLILWDDRRNYQYQIPALKAGSTKIEGFVLDVTPRDFSALPSVVHFDCLVELNLCYSNITTLWSGTSPRLSHLKRLYLTGSKDLKELPELQEAVCLEELMLEGCVSLTWIPESIYTLPRLQKVDMSNCDGLQNLRIIIGESEATSFIGRSLCVRSVRVDFLDAEPLVKEFQGII